MTKRGAPWLTLVLVVACQSSSKQGAPLQQPSQAVAGSPQVIAGAQGTGTAGVAPTPPAAGRNAASPGTAGSSGAQSPQAGASGAVSMPVAGSQSDDDAGPAADPDPVMDPRMDPPPATCADCCPDGFPRGTAMRGVRKLATLKPSPEGITVCADGQVFVAADDGGIWRVPLDGAAPERWATIANHQPAGISCDDKGRLFVAIYSVRSGGDAPAVMYIDGMNKPAVTLPAPSDSAAATAYNGILAVPGIGVYTSDNGSGRIVLYRETQPGMFTGAVVARDITLPNGIAYDPAKKTLFVADSLGFNVRSYKVAMDGSLSDQATVMTRTQTFFDGIAVDQAGAVYTANYLDGIVLRLSDSMNLGQITNPASLAFRGGTLLVTDYRLNQPNGEGGVYAIDLGQCGALTLKQAAP